MPTLYEFLARFARVATSALSCLSHNHSAQKWKEVEEISILALEKRIGLWNAIEEEIVMKTEMV